MQLLIGHGQVPTIMPEASNLCKIKWLDIILAVLPATIIVISENITKITLIEKIMRTAWFSSKYNICRKYCIDGN